MTSNAKPETGRSLSPEGLEQLLRLLVVDQGKRISSASVDGKTVWIKRLAAEARPLGKRLHALISPLIPVALLRSSKAVGPREMARRETGKIDAYRKAGFTVPDVVLHRDSTIVLSNVEPIIQNELKRLRQEPEAHDTLLVDCATALGKLHRAGLCHGRPHPRDMFLAGGEIGFLDFEEAPEEVMPLADAQARDIWLLFLQIAGQSLLPQTNQRALDAYRAAAPAEVWIELRKLDSLFGVLETTLRGLEHIYLGKDGRRLLKAVSFLHAAVAATPPAGPQTRSGPIAGQNPEPMQ